MFNYPFRSCIHFEHFPAVSSPLYYYPDPSSASSLYGHPSKEYLYSYQSNIFILRVVSFHQHHACHKFILLKKYIHPRSRLHKYPQSQSCFPLRHILGCSIETQYNRHVSVVSSHRNQHYYWLSCRRNTHSSKVYQASQFIFSRYLIISN